MATHTLLSSTNFLSNLLIYPHCNEANSVDLGKHFIEVLLISTKQEL